MKDKFTFEACSDLNYEGMVVDISWNDERIATLNHDKGYIEVELFSLHDKSLKCDITEFEKALDQAKNLLSEVNVE